MKADLLSGFIGTSCFKRMDEHVGNYTCNVHIKNPPKFVLSLPMELRSVVGIGHMSRLIYVFQWSTVVN